MANEDGKETVLSITRWWSSDEEQKPHYGFEVYGPSDLPDILDEMNWIITYENTDEHFVIVVDPRYTLEFAENQLRERFEGLLNILTGPQLCKDVVETLEEYRQWRNK